MLKCYVACPLAEVVRAQQVAIELQKRGIDVVSHWHWIVQPGDTDPKSMADRRAILAKNMRELATADVVLALTDRGTPRATFGEIGQALVTGKKVIWTQGSDSSGAMSYDGHENALIVYSIPEAIGAVCGLAFGLAA